jgi:hypothetical protein
MISSGLMICIISSDFNMYDKARPYDKVRPYERRPG